jgi:hypothetical protein
LVQISQIGVREEGDSYSKVNGEHKMGYSEDIEETIRRRTSTCPFYK